MNPFRLTAEYGHRFTMQNMAWAPAGGLLAVLALLVFFGTAVAQPSAGPGVLPLPEGPLPEGLLTADETRTLADFLDDPVALAAAVRGWVAAVPARAADLAAGAARLMPAAAWRIAAAAAAAAPEAAPRVAANVAAAVPDAAALVAAAVAVVVPRLALAIARAVVAVRPEAARHVALAVFAATGDAAVRDAVSPKRDRRRDLSLNQLAETQADDARIARQAAEIEGEAGTFGGPAFDSGYWVYAVSTITYELAYQQYQDADPAAETAYDRTGPAAGADRRLFGQALGDYVAEYDDEWRTARASSTDEAKVWQAFYDAIYGTEFHYWLHENWSRISDYIARLTWSPYREGIDVEPGGTNSVSPD